VQKRIEEFYRQLHGAASRVVESGEQHVQLVVALLEGSEEVGVVPQAAFMEKGEVAALHRALACTPGVECAAFICESWSWQGDARNPEHKRVAAEVEAGRMPLSEAPGAIEAVLFSLRCGLRCWVAAAPIDRSGPAPKLGEAELVDTQKKGASFHGRFAGPIARGMVH
jgi:hypothetical protein